MQTETEDKRAAGAYIYMDFEREIIELLNLARNTTRIGPTQDRLRLMSMQLMRIGKLLEEVEPVE